jgi:hypothetical protein
MNWRRWLLLVGCVSGLAGCEYEEVERVIGYQGEARRNPWLAAERMVSHYGYDVESLTSWRAPQGSDAVWFVPASALANQGIVRRAEKWVRSGGHLIVLLEKAGVETNDWSLFGPELALEPPLVGLLERAGIRLDQTATSKNAARVERVIPFDGDEFKVMAGAGKAVAMTDGEAGLFVSAEMGRGQLSAVTDARMFRNRWIDEQEHAELLLALVEVTNREGSVVFVRGATLSFWGLLKRHLWAVLIGLTTLLALWLWRSMRRFGPLEAATLPPAARGYDHHLEALGNFHWQLDRAANLLGPLRRQLAEHGQRGCERAGLAAAGLHAWLAERSGLPVARVERALAGEIPADGVALTRIVADLQVLLKLPQHGGQPADSPNNHPPPFHPNHPTTTLP